MPDNFRARVFNQAVGGLQADLQAAGAEFQKCELAGDAENAAAWLTEMANIRARVTETYRIANEEVAAQASRPAPNKYGLTDEQVDAAKTTGVSEEEYARGVRELAARKRQGMYSDGHH